MRLSKDPAAVSLGRRGGLKGGPARAAKLTPEQRQESAKRAAQARWRRYGWLQAEQSAREEIRQLQEFQRRLEARIAELRRVAVELESPHCGTI